jgi:putative efflux ABC transporter, permease protein
VEDMTLPFENDTRRIIHGLAKADLKTHKLKTFLTATIIVLATCLMATIFSVLVNDALDQANQAPYHAMYRAVNEDTKTTLQSDKDFEAVGIYKSFGNQVDRDGRTDLAYMDEQALAFMGFRLVDGVIPDSENEVLVSETYLKNRALSVGDTFRFAYVDSLTNEEREEEFTVCGTIQNKEQERGEQFYVVTSNSFQMKYAQQYSQITSDFSTETAATVDVLVLLNSDYSSTGSDTQKDFLKSKGESAGIPSFDVIINESYIDGVYFDGTVIAAVIFFTIFLMFASSFVIYSIFYISIVNSMPMYAQLISLGTTQKQLRRFLNTQGNMLAVRFIPLGALISILLIVLISGVQWLLYDALITLFAILLIYVVIKFALRKPAKLLANASPIEAMKFRDGETAGSHKALKQITPDSLAKSNLYTNRKKNRMSIISLSISGTLMIALAIFVSSINLPAMIRQSYPMDEDFQIGIQMDNFYERFPTIIQNNPLSDELMGQITDIPGVQKIILDECVMGRLVESAVNYTSLEDNLELLNSLSPELIANVSEIVSGTVSYDDLGTNEIVINKYRTDRSELNYGDLQVGDSLTFRFEVGGQTIEETFTVAGIAYFPSTGLFYCTQEAIEQISPYNNTTHISIFCDKNYTESVKDRLASLISGNPNLRLKVYSEEYSMIAGFINVTMSSLYAISAFVVIFGLLNMINMLINSAIIRKREFALLQAVGMTNRQLRKMLYREGMSVSIKSALLAAAFGITIGGLLCYLANKVMALKFVIFAIDPLPVLLFAAVLIGLQILVSYCICRSIEKTSLIENLRAE